MDLVRAYQANRANADKQYTGKTVTVTGRVGERQGNAVLLETGLPSILPNARPGVTDRVVVNFSNPADAASGARPGATITVQGVCAGFDFQFDVVLNNAQIQGGGANPGGGNRFPGKGKGKGPLRPGG